MFLSWNQQCVHETIFIQRYSPNRSNRNMRHVNMMLMCDDGEYNLSRPELPGNALPSQLPSTPQSHSEPHRGCFITASIVLWSMWMPIAGTSRWIPGWFYLKAVFFLHLENNATSGFVERKVHRASEKPSCEATTPLTTI